MTERKPILRTTTIALSLSFFALASLAFGSTQDDRKFIQVEAFNSKQRSKIAQTGMSIEAVRSDSVWGFANPRAISELKSKGHKVLGEFPIEIGRGGHEGIFDFPQDDAAYHNYKELMAEFQKLQSENPEIVKIQSIGKSVEKRDLWAIHFNSSSQNLETGMSGKPGIVFIGNHHAREHISVEVPLMLAQYLAAHKNDANIANLLATRDIWIIPMLNPDGAEFDVASGNYRMWRKNRKPVSGGKVGVDLNRNYDFFWNTTGVSSDPSSEVYPGPSAFSEPESSAVRDFIAARPNLKVLLSYHSYSELVLWPWGHLDEPIANSKDNATFETMGRTMAAWNGYTPERSAELYEASGDTCDWAYAKFGIFAFTFELSPSANSWGGFYPGADIIEQVFNANLKPALYLMDLADNPYRVLDSHFDSGFMN